MVQNTQMVVRCDVARLSASGGRRTMFVDGQTVEVDIDPRDGYTHLEIYLDKKFNRTPRWIPHAWGRGNWGDYPGYETESSFCITTLTAVLDELTEGRGQSYLPDYYTVRHGARPEEYHSEIVVPLQFEEETEGVEVAFYDFGNIRLIMFGVSPYEADGDFSPEPTQVTVGAFGMHVHSPREMNTAYLMAYMEGGWEYPMYLHFETPTPVPGEEGLVRLIADGQQLDLWLRHFDELSQVLAIIPNTFQRSPHYWPYPWGGPHNPGNYPGYETEKPFNGRLVRDIIQALCPQNPAACAPRSYRISYMDAGPGDSNRILPGRDVSRYGSTSATWLVPHANQYELLRDFTQATAIPNLSATWEHALPQNIELGQNFPNPFNRKTRIHFTLPTQGIAELAIYSLIGQKVATLMQGMRPAGVYTAHWDGRDDQGKALASGVYLYRLRAGKQVKTRRLMLMQ